MKSFDIFLGENLIANVEWKKQPVIHNSYFFKLRSVFGEKRLQSQDAEDAVKEAVDCMINHVKDMRQKEAERLVGVIVEEYNAKEFSKESTFSGWGVYHEGLYEGNCYDVTLIGDKQVQELVETTKDIDLKSMGIYLGKAANMVETVSCYEDNGHWVIKEITERQRVHERRGTEEEIVRKMYGTIKARL